MIFSMFFVNTRIQKIYKCLGHQERLKPVSKYKFVIGNFYRWEIQNNEDIKTQGNEYQKLVKELKMGKIILPEDLKQLS